MPPGSEFTKWAPLWIKSIKDDLNSIIEDDPALVLARNERFAAYLPTISTLIAIYRLRAREERDAFYKNYSKPEKGIKEWEERRDSLTSKYRYMAEWLVKIREDVMKRISVSQTNLGVYREEVKAHVD